MVQIKLEKKADMVSKSIRKAMIDADVTYDKIGEATARAWRYRISDTDRMTLGDFRYLCARLHVSPKDIIE